MARTSHRERPDQETVLWPIQKQCPACGLPMRVRYENRRTVVTLSGTQRLCLKIRRCEQAGCAPGPAVSARGGRQNRSGTS